jgi:hypothetical protein
MPIGNEQETLTIATISTNFEDNLNPQQNNKMTLDFILDNLVAKDDYIANTPISLKVNFVYDGAMPETSQAQGEKTPQQTSFKLSNFALHTKAAKLDATADFVSSSDDILPVGTATITATDIPAWRAIANDFGVADVKTEEMINSLLIRTTGTRLVDAKDVTIAINRVRDGAFQIGKSTFEEVVTIVLSGMRTPLDAPAPASTEPQVILPDADAPAKTAE